MDLREVDALLTELESRTDRLRALYEQYFLGFERLEPQVVRKDVERRMQALLRIPFRNTALRFRFTMLQQRYNTYQTYWMRTCRQIEEGTYKRQLQRLKAKESDYLRNVEAAAQEKVIEISEVEELELEELEDDAESAAPTLPPPPKPVAEPRAWVKPPAGSTFDTRPTTPRMKAVRLPIKPKTDEVAAAAEEPTPKAPEVSAEPKKPAVPPKLPVRAPIPNEMHSRPTVPRMQAVRLPEKK